MVWETFEVDIRGEFISLSPARKKVKNLFQQIKDLVQEHKTTGSRKAWEALKEKTDQLKLLDAQKRVKDIVYATQRLFAYKDKPGRFLAWLLAKETSHRTVPKMIKDNGTMTDSAEEVRHFFKIL